jgi:hypothetical protein
MTTEELTQAQRELNDARREREELDGLISGLEEQVRAGEASDAEQQLAERYSLQKLAQLRQQAAECGTLRPQPLRSGGGRRRPRRRPIWRSSAWIGSPLPSMRP